jgi:hypothetical protein
LRSRISTGARCFTSKRRRTLKWLLQILPSRGRRVKGMRKMTEVKDTYGNTLFMNKQATTVKVALENAVSSWVSLRGADLTGADLRGANLTGVSLREADLRGADLTWADLRGADLREADLTGADLTWADLRGAKLTGVSLTWADLTGADLRGANLRGVICPTMVLLAYWGELSDELTIELMRYDAYNCPDGEAQFTKWAQGGPCPYNGTGVTRCANFKEKRELWSPGPALSAYELMVMLFKEKNIKWGSK